MRNGLEEGSDGREHMVARGMNWRAEPADRTAPSDRLAQQILHGLAAAGGAPGVVRSAQLDAAEMARRPCPFYDWRRIAADSPRIHPDDEAKRAAMRTEFAAGAACAVLRHARLTTAGGSRST